MKIYNNFGASGSRMTKRRLLEEGRNSTWQISVQNVISRFLVLILLFVSYSLISFNFYLFYFPGAAAEPLGSVRGALRAPRSTGWEPLLYRMCSTLVPSTSLHLCVCIQLFHSRSTFLEDMACCAAAGFNCLVCDSAIFSVYCRL